MGGLCLTFHPHTTCSWLTVNSQNQTENDDSLVGASCLLHLMNPPLGLLAQHTQEYIFITRSEILQSIRWELEAFANVLQLTQWSRMKSWSTNRSQSTCYPLCKSTRSPISLSQDFCTVWALLPHSYPTHHNDGHLVSTLSIMYFVSNGSHEQPQCSAVKPW